VTVSPHPHALAVRGRASLASSDASCQHTSHVSTASSSQLSGDGDGIQCARASALTPHALDVLVKRGRPPARGRHALHLPVRQSRKVWVECTGCVVRQVCVVGVGVTRERAAPSCVCRGQRGPYAMTHTARAAAAAASAPATSAHAAPAPLVVTCSTCASWPRQTGAPHSSSPPPHTARQHQGCAARLGRLRSAGVTKARVPCGRVGVVCAVRQQRHPADTRQRERTPRALFPLLGSDETQHAQPSPGWKYPSVLLNVRWLGAAALSALASVARKALRAAMSPVSHPGQLRGGVWSGALCCVGRSWWLQRGQPCLACMHMCVGVAGLPASINLGTHGHTRDHTNTLHVTPTVAR
jgi:hypothetical protein